MRDVRRRPPARPVAARPGGVPAAAGPLSVPERLTALQRTAGNRAVAGLVAGAGLPVQRAITILSYNVGKRGPDDAELDVPVVRTAIQRAVPPPNQARVLANLQNADAHGWQGGDVVALATHLTAGMPAATRDLVAEAIGGTLTAQGTNPEEAGQFEATRARAQSMSRAKGTPNQITVGDLDTATGAGIAGIAARIRALDAKLARRQPAVRDVSVEAWAHQLGADVNVREAHGNAAGWLPAVDIAARHGQLKGVVDHRVGLPRIQQWIAGNSELAARYDVIASDRFFTAEDRRYFVWSSHADAVSPYIEFSVPGKKDQRLVFDFVHQTIYWTVHYKWYKGFNPFFEVQGA